MPLSIINKSKLNNVVYYLYSFDIRCSSKSICLSPYNKIKGLFKCDQCLLSITRTETKQQTLEDIRKMLNIPLN